MQESQIKRIILCGKAGSGKDYLRDALICKRYRGDISVTTRPMREGEVADKTYFYRTEEEFKSLCERGQVQESDRFNGWSYGTLKSSWERSEVFIKTPSAIKQLSREERRECLVVYLDIGERTRRERMDKRSDADSVET